MAGEDGNNGAQGAGQGPEQGPEQQAGQPGADDAAVAAAAAEALQQAAAQQDGNANPAAQGADQAPAAQPAAAVPAQQGGNAAPAAGAPVNLPAAVTAAAAAAASGAPQIFYVIQPPAAAPAAQPAGNAGSSRPLPIPELGLGAFSLEGDVSQSRYSPFQDNDGEDRRKTSPHNSESELEAELHETIEALEKATTVSLSGGGTIKPPATGGEAGSAKLAVQRGKVFSMGRYGVAVVISVNAVKNRTVKLFKVGSDFTADALKLLDSPEGVAKFYKRYGDGFVYAIDGGTEMRATLVYNGHSVAQKKSLSLALSVAYKGGTAALNVSKVSEAIRGSELATLRVSTAPQSSKIAKPLEGLAAIASGATAVSTSAQAAATDENPAPASAKAPVSKVEQMGANAAEILKRLDDVHEGIDAKASVPVAHERLFYSDAIEGLSEKHMAALEGMKKTVLAVSESPDYQLLQKRLLKAIELANDIEAVRKGGNVFTAFEVQHVSEPGKASVKKSPTDVLAFLDEHINPLLDDFYGLLENIRSLHFNSSTKTIGEGDGAKSLLSIKNEVSPEMANFKTAIKAASDALEKRRVWLDGVYDSLEKSLVWCRSLCSIRVAEDRDHRERVRIYHERQLAYLEEKFGPKTQGNKKWAKMPDAQVSSGVELLFVQPQNLQSPADDGVELGVARCGKFKGANARDKRVQDKRVLAKGISVSDGHTGALMRADISTDTAKRGVHGFFVSDTKKSTRLELFELTESEAELEHRGATIPRPA